MLACAMLPFLSIIVDTRIRQLGDDYFGKREAATRFLSKVLQDTDGCRNYSILLKVKKASECKDAEIRIRAQRLYETFRKQYFGEHRFFCIFTTELDKAGMTSKAYEKAIKITEGAVFIRWGRQKGGQFAVLCATPKKFNSLHLARIKAHKEVILIVPAENDEDIPWKRARK